jgi:RNA polymerase sigma-70 factor, ECF subfamily
VERGSHVGGSNFSYQLVSGNRVLRYAKGFQLFTTVRSGLCLAPGCAGPLVRHAELPRKERAMNVQDTPLEDRQGREGGAASDEQQLVALAKSGHSGAFGELYERHRERIYRSALRILRNKQDAEDAVQRSFEHAFTRLNRFREDCAFLTWMTRIVMNEALMLLRRKRIRTPLLEANCDHIKAFSPVDLADERPTPEQALFQNELHTIMTDAVSRLREKLRVVVLLCELQGLSIAETARRLGLTVSAVKARAFRARRQLRQDLERNYKTALANSLNKNRNQRRFGRSNYENKMRMSADRM